MKYKPPKPYYFAVWILLTLPLTACGLSGEPQQGTVIDAATDRPVEGAIVVARWIGHAATWAHGRTVCYHVESTTSDKAGRFHIPEWKKAYSEDWQKNISPRYVDITAYKPGYQFSPRQIGEESELKGVFYVEPFTTRSSKRLDYLTTLSATTVCGEARESNSNLLLLKKAIYREATAVAETPQDRGQVEIIRFGLESLEFGGVEALKRMTERQKHGDKNSH